jgi:hypothetical protein
MSFIPAITPDCRSDPIGTGSACPSRQVVRLAADGFKFRMSSSANPCGARIVASSSVQMSIRRARVPFNGLPTWRLLLLFAAMNCRALIPKARLDPLGVIFKKVNRAQRRHGRADSKMATTNLTKHRAGEMFSTEVMCHTDCGDRQMDCSWSESSISYFWRSE